MVNFTLFWLIASAIIFISSGIISAVEIGVTAIIGRCVFILSFISIVVFSYLYFVVYNGVLL